MAHPGVAAAAGEEPSICENVSRNLDAFSVRDRQRNHARRRLG